MITEEQAKKLFDEGKVKVFTNKLSDSVFYYYVDVDDNLKNYLRLNDICVAFSEWIEFYYDIKETIEHKTNDKNVVPIITLEMSQRCGL